MLTVIVGANCDFMIFVFYEQLNILYEGDFLIRSGYKALYSPRQSAPFCSRPLNDARYKFVCNI